MRFHWPTFRFTRRNVAVLWSAFLFMTLLIYCYVTNYPRRSSSQQQYTVIIQLSLQVRNWGAAWLGGSGLRSLVRLPSWCQPELQCVLLGLLINAPGCCQNASVPCPVNFLIGWFVCPSNMAAGFFHSAWFKWKQDGSHSIIYDLALEVISIFYGLHESILFCVREPHKAKNARRQGSLGATILEADYLNYKILTTPDPFVSYDCHNTVPQTGWLKLKFISSQFHSLEVWDQGINAVSFSWDLSLLGL